MGCAQLELLDEYIQAKRRIAARYAESLAEAPGITLSDYWLYLRATIVVSATRL